MAPSQNTGGASGVYSQKNCAANPNKFSPEPTTTKTVTHASVLQGGQFLRGHFMGSGGLTSSWSQRMLTTVLVICVSSWARPSSCLSRHPFRIPSLHRLMIPQQLPYGTTPTWPPPAACQVQRERADFAAVTKADLHLAQVIHTTYTSHTIVCTH